MKKYFSFLLLFICAAASAQVTTSVKAGVSLANIHFKSDNDVQLRVLGYGGVSFNIEMPNQLFFQPELLYSIRGYKFPASATSEEGRVTLGYITAPLLLGYKLTKTFSILAGPEIGYLVRARSRYGDYNTDFYDGIGRKFNVDADAGIALQVTKEIVLEARVSIGVVALYRGVLTDPLGNDMGEFKDGYHRVLQVGFSIPL